MAGSDRSNLSIEIGDDLSMRFTPANLPAMPGVSAEMRATSLVPLWYAPLLFCGQPGKPEAFMDGDDQSVFKFGRCLVRWVELIARAVDRGELLAREPDGLSVMDNGESVTPACLVHWRELEEWAMNRHGLSAGYLSPEEMRNPTLPVAGPSDWRDDPELLKREKQDRAVLEVIKAKEWRPLSVPDGEKGTLELLCGDEYPELFGASTAFQTTWKRGLKNGRWRMQSHASYQKRGRK